MPMFDFMNRRNGGMLTDLLLVFVVTSREDLTQILSDAADKI